MAVFNSSLTGLAIDGQSLSRLKLEANKSPEQAVAGAAKQFEAVFLNMMLKSMRDAIPHEDPLESESTKLYRGMLDQEFSQRFSAKGIGLADVMIKQLSRNAPPTADGTLAPGAAASVQSTPATRISRGHSSPDSVGRLNSPRAFVERVWDEANQAARATGIPAKFMIGQAALESGWGRREIRGADGSPSYNIFGIKAGKSWTGPTVETMTTEYADGVPRKVPQKFRAYSSYAEAFSDYARLITDNPRYANTLEHADDSARFAQSLQRAGYATDPRYAEKLARVINHSAIQEMVA